MDETDGANTRDWQLVERLLSGQAAKARDKIPRGCCLELELELQLLSLGNGREG